MKTNFFILFLLSFYMLFSQQQLIKTDLYTTEKTEKAINKNNLQIHDAFKPLIKSQFSNKINIDSILYEYGRDSAKIAKLKHPVWRKKLRTEDLLVVNENDFNLRINLLFNFAMGKNTLNDSSLSINSRGILIEGDIGKNFSFVSEFHENQAFFPDYIRDFSKEYKVVPGQGRLRGFKNWGFDYANASGSISFTPLKELNFTLGHGKHFIGNGYRSLLMSDNSFYYPYFKITTTLGKFQYNYMLTSFQAASTEDTRTLVYHRKHGSFLFLNYFITKKLQIGLFEGVMFKTSDSTSNNNIPANFFNPVILTRSFSYGLSNKNNVLLGLNAKWDIASGIQFYGQYMLDDDVAKKNGWQIGVKDFDLFGIKNLYFQFEYNQVRPYSYAHNNVNQSWSYYNQAFASPLGAGFKESIFMLRYRYKDFILRFKYNYAITATDYYIETLPGKKFYTNLGVDIFKPDNTASLQPISKSKIGYDNETYISNVLISLAYLINPVTNFQIFFDYHNRNNTAYGETNFFYFGLRTNLSNVYYDF